MGAELERELRLTTPEQRQYLSLEPRRRWQTLQHLKYLSSLEHEEEVEADQRLRQSLQHYNIELPPPLLPVQKLRLGGQRTLSSS